MEPRIPGFDFSSKIAALPPGKPLKDVRFPCAVWTVEFTFDAMFLSCKKIGQAGCRGFLKRSPSVKQVTEE